MISITEIVKEMLDQRRRLLLTILAIAWGTMAITVMLAIGQGLRVSFGSATQSAGKGILIVYPGNTSKSYKGVPAAYKVQLTPQDLQAIKATIPAIKDIAGEYSFVQPLSYKNNKPGYNILSAVTPEFAKIRSLTAQAGGRFINPIDMLQQKRVIFLGNKIAENLFPHKENPVGKRVLLGQWPFTVIGVLQKKMEMSGMMPDAFRAWIPASTYVSLTQAKSLSDIVITPKNANNNPQIITKIRQLVAHRHGLNPNDQQIIQFDNLADQQQRTQGFLIGLQAFLGIIGIITLIVAGVGIANVMFTSISRSTRQIGIRIAIGARSWQILWYYIIEAILVTIVGGIIGMVVSYLITFGINQIPIHAKIMQWLPRPKPTISVSVIISVISALGIIGFIAGFFPARKAANINPAEALRYE